MLPPCKFINANMISTSDEVFLMQELKENECKENVKHDYISPTVISNLETIDTISNTTDFSVLSESEFYKARQLAYGNESLKYNSKSLNKFKSSIINESNTLTKQNTKKNNAITKYSSKVDHVYEEVNTLECDIMDYYEKYSPTTAKTLINTLFLPRYKICKQCANLQGSPVYSDRLIYAKKPLYAKEVHLLQQNESLNFKYCSEDGKHNNILFLQYDDVQHCLLVYNYLKTNSSSIFYYYGPPRDVFDLKTTLKPNIIVTNSSTRGVVNTELYHRSASNFYRRISNNGIAPTVFYVNHNNMLSSIKHVGYDTDLQNWMHYRNDVFRLHNLKQDDVIDLRANRSSLLLLEPLLLMPELGNSRYRPGKNRISQSEHIKIVKIVIAYTLSFFILATITFYIVYFT
ncbi:PREDICTED: uncharacterized protein LOC108551407 [Eufriesea mexicana]|uniref:uncharacterized protein LOC108551407 n=1 Tax=Eufriesea mexicana TaxID=516756 RepID=UPI00083C88AC|nr:PREDICTED: uncharacterized protein LOC108551407 [Eufriesea mexicana]